METKESKLFHILDESTKILMNKLGIAYLEALIHSAENLIDDGKVFNDKDLLSEEVVYELKNKYKKIDLTDYEPEMIRKAMQLAMLRGMKEDYIQANHQMTPDSLGNLIAYLIEIIVEPEKSFHLADLSAGTGNLLLTVHHFLNQEAKRQIKLSGIDNDELMLSLASTNSAIQRTPVNLQYQDALSNILLQPIDIVVSDLPVGYYPLAERAEKYETHFSNKDDQSYSHYLLIEQSINYLKEGGYAFFLLPTNLFNDPKVKILIDYLNKVSYIQAIVELPEEIFANEQSRKSVLVIQKKGKKAKQMDEVLLSKAPNFKNFDAMKIFLGEIKEWKKNNK